MIASRVDAFLACLVPRRCVLCNEPGVVNSICGGCQADLPWLGAVCPGCGVGLPSGTGTGPCGCCGTRLPGHGAVIAPLTYEFPVDRMVTGAKFHRQLYFARALGELLGEFLAREAGDRPRPDVLVPVPLHRGRLARRGYNQALEIARPVARRLGLPLSPRLVERIRGTPEQTGLTALQRRRNLRGAFRASAGCRGARVAVLDDVITTGSTVAALAGALRAAGAVSVEVWAPARTPGRGAGAARAATPVGR